MTIKVQRLVYFEENANEKATATSKFGVHSWTLFSFRSSDREFQGDPGKISREIPVSHELLDGATVSLLGDTLFVKQS
jgi:hypothetical protein